jgi:hypothetical protein
VLLWQGVDGLCNALLLTGLAIIPLGLLALGTAMHGAPDFGRRLGMVTVAFGAVGLAGAIAALAGVASMAAVGVLALTAFHTPPSG